MSLVEWKDEFNLGIEEVDIEHRNLVALINALHEAMLAGASRADIVEGITQIYTLVSTHFDREEAFMRETRYMAYAEHKEDHEVLLDDLREILDQVRSGGRYAEERLSDDLQYWFSEHFRTHDARLHQHAQCEERPRW
ncbi:MAG: bacteriohemerythrin [Gammaproteobacteria bacterium]|jgi:hemerythrin|nr:bacteriohemerythrin [Gammaproteobacteria bacterium]MDH3848123.1 bacteriohemerythrin [Gammaproteobacteria bacterium]MDH3862575.1 bacteriohemerythrin [Gammaproteobacteria bacterium]MDH3904373.1 bacteriohemerythrin [Gammaproteobacteria bacterium]MDH3907894.1 bacteriohemerythrin [Gammaproteobacteria bacterium]